MLRIAILALVLAACGGPPDPGLRPQHARSPALAPDIDWAETSFAGAGGVPIYVQRWRPASAPKGVVAIHHGLADHSDRYAAFAAQLVKAGYAVWAFDMRGHGRSGGARVSIDRIDDALDDLDGFLQLVRKEQPGQPIFLYGHSLGGLITSLYAIERQPTLAGLVLAAPGIAFDAPPLQAAVVRTVAAIDPNAGILDTPHAAFSRRAEVVAEMNADPLIYQPSGPSRTARAAVDGVARVWAAPERLRVPLLVIHGTADQLTAPAGSRDLVARAGTTDKTLRVYDGLYHDLLREPGGAGDRVAGEVVAWLDGHAGGPASTLTSTPTPGELAGDGRGRAMSVELDARGELPRHGSDDGISGGLRLRFGLGRATAAGLGYLGGLDLRGGYLAGAHYEADAHLAGLALRSTGGALVSLTGGVGFGGVRGAKASHLPVELSVELPAGPVRVLARGAIGWRLGGARYADHAASGVDEATALVGVRLGRDVRYWAEVAGGSGPFLAVTYRNLGGAELFGVAFGLDLWGGN